MVVATNLLKDMSLSDNGSVKDSNALSVIDSYIFYLR